MPNKPPLEITLAMLKPHILKNPYGLKTIRRMILTNNFKVVQTVKMQMTIKIAEAFYGEHKGKPFFNRLVGFMTSGPSFMHILARENCIREWRKLMGPTKIFKAQFEEPYTIRGMFALSNTRNAVHGSDSVQSAEREIKIIFPKFDIAKWYQEEEEFFRMGMVRFDQSQFVHISKKYKERVS